MNDRGGSWGNPRTTTPQWRRLRRIILDRDNERCYLCGNHANEVDHIDGNHHNEQRTNLAAICHPCHTRKSSNEGNNARRIKYGTPRHHEPHPGIQPPA